MSEPDSGRRNPGLRPLAVLFSYYGGSPAWDRLQAAHFALLREHNPGVPVVPLYDRAGVPPGFRPFLPGSVDVGAFPWRWGANRAPWWNVDTFAYRWFLHARTPETDAERFLFVESDTRVTAPLAGVFAPCWAADIAGAVAVRQSAGDAPGWAWWPHVAHLPPRCRAGVMPSGVVLYSRAALDWLATTTPDVLPDAFPEVRIASGATLFGGRVEAVPGLVETVHEDARAIRLGDAPGVYHPVKG